MVSNQTLLPNPYLLQFFGSILNHLHYYKCSNWKFTIPLLTQKAIKLCPRILSSLSVLNTNMFTLRGLAQEGANINGVVGSPFPG